MDSLEFGFSGAFSIQLPSELWILVLSQICPDPKSFERNRIVARLDIDQNKSRGDEVLQNVSQTSRLLHDLVLPIRFRHVELHGDGTEETRPTELYGRLSKSENLWNLVKIVSVWVYDKGFPRLPDSAQDILYGMHNLQEIRLETPFNMTTPLYSHICALPSLHRLRVTTLPQHTPDITDITPIVPNQLSVDSLFVRCRRTTSGYRELERASWCPYWARAIPSPWITYVALSPSTRHLRLEAHAIILPSIDNTRTIAPPSPHLITLEVTTPRTMREWEEFCQFISLAPLISTLVFGYDVWSFRGPAPDQPLPSELLPALRHFEGVLHYANLIVPGRPVDTIVLTPLLFTEYSDDLHALTLSTASIRSIEIRIRKSLTYIAMIVESFSDLEEFHMMVSSNADSMNAQEWLQNNFVSEVERLQHLRTFGLEFHNEITADDEKDALFRLSEDHPLESARFSRCSHQWLCKCEDGLWQKRFDVWVRPKAESGD